MRLPALPCDGRKTAFYAPERRRLSIVRENDQRSYISACRGKGAIPAGSCLSRLRADDQPGCLPAATKHIIHSATVTALLLVAQAVDGALVEGFTKYRVAQVEHRSGEGMDEFRMTLKSQHLTNDTVGNVRPEITARKQPGIFW